MGASKLLVPKICEYCGKPFMAKTVTTHFCCKTCNNKSIRERNKREKEEKEQMNILELKKAEIAELQIRRYISIPEASKLYGVSEKTLRRLVRRGTLKATNLGVRLTRVDHAQLEQFFTSIIVPDETEQPKKYEPDECYTIGECLKKYDLPETKLESIIKGFHIPKRQIGSFVYIPKAEIDKIMNASTKTVQQ